MLTFPSGLSVINGHRKHETACTPPSLVSLRNHLHCPKGLLCRDLSNFVVRPSSSVVPSRLSHSVLDRDFAKDACQELDSRSKPGPFGTFCKTSPYGRQSGCRTWPFLDHSRLSPDVIHHDSARHSMWEVFIVTQHIMTPHRLRKFERFLHNSPSGHPCPAGVI